MADTTTQRTVDAEFDIDSWDEVPYDEPDEGPKLTRVVIRKTYRGALDGTGVADVLTAQGPKVPVTLPRNVSTRLWTAGAGRS